MPTEIKDLKPSAARLAEELGRADLDLSEAEVLRTVFLLCALKRNWSKAKIARYLGITRARVGQKHQKCLTYAQSEAMPRLRKYMESLPAEADKPDASESIGFTKEQWTNLGFAVSMVNLVA